MPTLRFGPAAPLLAGFLDASQRSDPLALRARLDAAAARLGLAGCIDQVLFPGMRQLGLAWRDAGCDLEQERLTTEAARAWLDRLTAFAPTPAQSRPVVLACGPGEVHTMGLEALGVLLRYRRRACRVLGARTSARQLGTAVRASDASAVVVVCHLGWGRRRAVQSLSSARAQGVALFYAGGAFGSAEQRIGVPGSYLGTRVQDACEVIDRALGAETG